MAAGMPTLLAMSVESTLRPKIEFLLGDFAALPSDVAGFPQARPGAPRAPSPCHLCSLCVRLRVAPSRPHCPVALPAARASNPAWRVWSERA